MSINNIKETAVRTEIRQIWEFLRRINSQTSSIFVNNTILPQSIDHTVLNNVGTHGHNAIDALLRKLQNFLDANKSYTLPDGHRWIACDYFELRDGAELTLAVDSVLCIA